MIASSELSLSHQIESRTGDGVVVVVVVVVVVDWSEQGREVSHGRDMSGGGVVVGSAVRAYGGCERNEWNAAIIRAAAEGGRYVEEGRGSNAELANNDEGGQKMEGVCYGGI
jgi:hypothetical protein